MTREIRTNVKTFQYEVSSAQRIVSPTCGSAEKVSNKRSFAELAASVFTRVCKAKRELSDRFVAMTEVLADKTAREGLFGEDKNKNYCGTDTDYISD